MKIELDTHLHAQFVVSPFPDFPDGMHSYRPVAGDPPVPFEPWTKIKSVQACDTRHVVSGRTRHVNVL